MTERHFRYRGQEYEEEKPAEELPEISFDELPDAMRQGCDRAGWDRLMPVQAMAIPAVRDRKDVLVQARTGSGKTGAFVLPLLERIDPNKNHCQALVLTPTRELAKQVADEAEMLSGGSIRTVAVYGGVGYGPQIEGFKKGAHLVVGTPGRILDHLMRASLSLEHLDALIFDEADRMLSIGFYPDMKQVQRYLPNRKINTMMFSATFPPMVVRLSEEFLADPQLISLSGKQVHVAEVTHAYYDVPAMGKERSLMRIIEVENPESAIIFCNTKANTHFVAEVLTQFGYDADALSSDLSQSKRERILTRVRGGNLRFLVATDVAARGIDIPQLSHVILYEPPEDKESYIHRAGRTGRAGAAGEVLSLVDVIQKIDLDRIAAEYTIELEHRPLPTDEDASAASGHRALAQLEARLRAQKPLARERVARFVPLAKELAEDTDGLNVLAMLLDEFYFNTVVKRPAPETTPKPAPRQDRKSGGRDQSDSGRSSRKPRQPRQARDDDRRSRQDQDRKPRDDRRPRQDEDDRQERTPRERRPEPQARREEPRVDTAAEAKPAPNPTEGDEQPKRRRKRRPRRRKKRPSGGE